MNALSGYIELELSGDEEKTLVPFKFGTNAWALFCERRKIEFHQIVDTGVFGTNFIVLRELLYCAYIAALRSKNKEVTLNLEQFTDLLDETPDALPKLQEVILQSKILGFSLTELAGEGKIEKK